MCTLMINAVRYQEIVEPFSSGTLHSVSLANVVEWPRIQEHFLKWFFGSPWPWCGRLENTPEMNSDPKFFVNNLQYKAVMIQPGHWNQTQFVPKFHLILFLFCLKHKRFSFNLFHNYYYFFHVPCHYCHVPECFWLSSCGASDSSDISICVSGKGAQLSHPAVQLSTLSYCIGNKVLSSVREQASLTMPGPFCV